MVAGVHYRPHDPADSIGWKLAAVNLSDLAAKGAVPVGCLLNYALSGDAGWDRAFLAGLNQALTRFAMPLLGGDTVAMPAGAPRSLTLTAFGQAQPNVPLRTGVRPGDTIWVTGTIGGAGFGPDGSPRDLARYLRPQPRVAEGQAIAALATAMMDVSDGLLIDAAAWPVPATWRSRSISTRSRSRPQASIHSKPRPPATITSCSLPCLTGRFRRSPLPVSARRAREWAHAHRGRRARPAPGKLGYSHG
ncbi:thiamine-monophosphate kinase [Ditylenchus destructor]|uniref:Thiamine-monophosphate kinase n=1 Tax=Ditylenchus destructor TaxID=166010 RepID=A0AAD4MF98_9BILA|nr:thiamine-monophosphate kinase [Ditylenchus destructor]